MKKRVPQPIIPSEKPGSKQASQAPLGCEHRRPTRGVGPNGRVAPPAPSRHARARGPKVPSELGERAKKKRRALAHSLARSLTHTNVSHSSHMRWVLGCVRRSRRHSSALGLALSQWVRFICWESGKKIAGGMMNNLLKKRLGFFAE